LQTHREEKISRARSAAIIVEQKAAEANPSSQDDSSITLRQNVETDAAIYINGEVHIKGNPLETTKEIRCEKCGLPRLLHPTDGNGARKPEPGKEYCKKRPFIEKPYHDIYGQTYVPEGPGRGKKKKDMVNPLLQQKEGTPSGSQDGSEGISDGPAKPIPFPHAKCHNCSAFLPIKRMNNHMVKCIGGGGRISSREAFIKIQNGNGNGSSQSNGGTPPGSRLPTPAPGAGGNGKRSSPNKREAGDDFDFDSDSPVKKKKFLGSNKKSGSTSTSLVTNNPKTKLKAPKMLKTPSQHSASNLSFEHKMPLSDDEDDNMDDGGDDDHRDGDFGSVAVEPKKKVIKPGLKKKDSGGGGGADKKKKLVYGKASASHVIKPIAEPPDSAAPTKLKLKVKNTGATVGGLGQSVKREEDTKSESSQTLSSPN